MKKQLIYIHGGSSYQSKADFLEYLRTAPLRDPLPVGESERPKRWSDSLAADLGDDFAVYAPTMPNKQNADYEEWKVWFERYLELVSDGVILVGWSQGAWLLAKYLAENKPFRKIRALFLVAGPSSIMNEVGGDNPAWAFDLLALRARVETERIPTYILHSEDDPVVPFSHAEAYAQALPEAVFVPFANRGHFLVPELPELIELITRA